MYCIIRNTVCFRNGGRTVISHHAIKHIIRILHTVITQYGKQYLSGHENLTHISPYTIFIQYCCKVKNTHYSQIVTVITGTG